MLKTAESGIKVTDAAKAYSVNRSTVNLTRRYGRAIGGARVCDDVPLFR